MCEPMMPGSYIPRPPSAIAAASCVMLVKAEGSSNSNFLLRATKMRCLLRKIFGFDHSPNVTTSNIYVPFRCAVVPGSTSTIRTAASVMSAVHVGAIVEATSAPSGSTTALVEAGIDRSGVTTMDSRMLTLHPRTL